MTKAIQILIVDDHPLVCLGMTQLIQSEPNLRVCGSCKDALEALNSIASQLPDLVIVDISLSGSQDGIQLTHDLHARYPQLPILILSMLSENHYAERALRAGARGYIMKEEATEKLLSAIYTALQGKIYLSDAMTERLLKTLSGQPAADNRDPVLAKLSDRELEVFRLIGQGLKIKEIAQVLNISDKTADVHRTNIKRKLQLDSSTSLYYYAFQWLQQAGLN